MTLTRTLTVTYGSYSFSPSRIWRLYDGFERGEVSCQFIVRAATASALATACAAAISAFRIPHQRTQVKYGSTAETAEIDWNPASGVNTGFNAQPLIRKIGAPADSGQSQTFEITITVEKPADTNSRLGRRSADIAVSETPSGRRTITLTGIWTAITSNEAIAQYEAQFETWAATVRSLVDSSATWERTDQDYNVNDINKTLHFRVVFRELLHGQLTGDDTSVREQHFFLTVSQPLPGDSPLDGAGGELVQRFADVRARYDASADFDVAPDLETVYQLLLPQIAARIQTVTGAIGLALIDPGKQFDYDEHRIVLNMSWTAAFTKYVEFHRKEQTKFVAGSVLVPVWSGNRFARYVFRGPETMTLEVVENGMYVGDPTWIAFEGPLDASTKPPAGAKWVHTGSSGAAEPRILGAGSGYEMRITIFNASSEFEAASQAKVSTSQFTDPLGKNTLRG